jgi:hypothetical protein
MREAMVQKTDQGEPSGFWIVLPDGWVTLDIDPRTAPRTHRRLLRSMVKAEPGLAAHRTRLEADLNRLSRECSEQGVTFAASFIALVDDELPMNASLNIATYRTDLNHVDVLRASLLDVEFRHAVDLFELDDGRAVRVRGRDKLRYPGAEDDIEVASRQFHVPIPGSNGRVALLTFITSSLPFEEGFAELFDTMAKTFRFTYGESSLAEVPADIDPEDGPVGGSD